MRFIDLLPAQRPILRAAPAPSQSDRQDFSEIDSIVANAHSP
jgi:hypothetical protein